jgi:alkanesulfonate monooxygenase SsuD/methylene tetrahydromethanopterin reductase-like flavin-dependent oxidoreductase (luciferase family)
MRFGLIFTIQSPERWARPLTEQYAATLEHAELAEELGYTYALVGEHHFLPDSFCPQPLVVAGAMAARTTTLRVGTSVYLVPLHHPLELAEQAAVIDVMSGGRLVLGLGVGYRPEEFEGFGVARTRRGKLMDAALERMLAAFDPRSDVTPKPVQQPHPPIWLAATSRPGMERAARTGLIPFYAVAPTPVIERQQRLYAELCERHERTPSDVVPIVRETFVAETTEEAWRVAGEHLMHTYRHDYRAWSTKVKGVDTGVVVAEPDGSLRIARDFDDEVFEQRRFAQDRLLIGSPDEVIEALRDLRERIGVTEVLCRMHHPGLPDDAARRSMELLASEVMPAFDTQGVPT